MAVPSVITDLSSTAASNSPAGGEAIGTNADNYIRAGFAFTRQLFAHAALWAGTAGGTANALTLTPSPAITAYTTGQRFVFKAGASPNSSTTTVNINSVGAKNIYVNGAACSGGEIKANLYYSIVYDGTQFQLSQWGPPSSLSPSTFVFPSAASPSQTAEGSAVWDSDDDVLTIGTGSTRKTLVDTNSPQTITGKSIVGTQLTSAQLSSGVGFSATAYNAGTKSSGTYTPDPANGNFQYATNGGAHTLAPPTNPCTIVVEYLNNGSAGAVTTSGFTKVDGAFTTTNTHKFACYITKTQNYSYLNIVALQ